MFVLTPVIIGALAGVAVFQEPTVAATLALTAGLMPAIKDALRLDLHVDHIKSLAAEFKELQDAFRQLGTIIAPNDPEIGQNKLELLMEQLGRARSHSVTIPDKTFRQTQEKIERGDYNFAADMKHNSN